MTCVDCRHYFLCSQYLELYNTTDKNKKMECRFFMDDNEYVKVVRCKDCKHEYTDTFCQMWCRLHRKHEGERLVEEDHFCSYGERRDT